MDLSKPFNLYGGHFRLGFSERLNLLERETVQIYKKRLYQFEGIEQYLKTKHDSKLDEAEKGLLKPTTYGKSDLKPLFAIPPELKKF